MRREIKINYDKLEELAGKIQAYQSALSKMKDSIGRIWEALGENTGEAIEALTERKEIIEKRIASCEEELEDLYGLIGGYCYDMQAIIPAEDKSRMMTIDRNDIWFNLKSIENTCGRLADLDSFAPVSWAGPVYTPFADDEVKEQEERYGELLEEMRETVRSAYHNRIVDCLDDMDRIYREKIAAFENKDDEYAQKAEECYWKYSSACEAAFDGVEWLGDTVEGITKGAVEGVSELIDGIGSLLYGTGELLASGIAWLVCTAADGKMPDWAKARLEGAKETVNDILSDPMGLIEGMCQGISDTYEEEGIWYCAGYTAGTIAGTKGIASGLKGVGAELKAKGHLGIWDDVEKGASGAGGSTGYDYLDDQLGSLKGKVKINRYESAESVNDFWKSKSYVEPPYKPQTVVQSIELLENTSFVRVYNGTDSGMYGGWLMKAEDIVGLTPKEIQIKYALPYEPIYIAEVKIPAGNSLNMGTANKLFGYEGGGIQFDLKGQQIGEFTELGKITDWSK